MSVYKNKLLNRLDAATIERLKLKPTKLDTGRQIEFTGDSIDNLFFIESGVGSMTTTFKDGSQVEVGLFGFESVIGISALMGTKRSLNKIYMQISGHGFASQIDVARAEFIRNERFQFLALRYVQAQLTQATQSAGCNARHSIEQRLARWLLLCADRVGNDLPISQEFIGIMLGVTRPSVTIAFKVLIERSLIEHTRNRVRILDRQGLEALACECYRVVRDHLDNYTEFDTGFTV